MSYLEQLRSAAAKLDPLGQLLRDRAASAYRALSDPVRFALAELTARADAMGVVRLSTREVYLKLGIPEALKLGASMKPRRAAGARQVGLLHTCFLGGIEIAPFPRITVQGFKQSQVASIVVVFANLGGIERVKRRLRFCIERVHALGPLKIPLIGLQSGRIA
jgi:hypothetical protein